MSSVDNLFPPASRDDWVSAVEKMLRKEGALDGLRRRDEDGLIIDALYDSATIQLVGDMASSIRRLPYDPVQRMAHGWDIRQPLHINGDSKAMNRSLLDDVQQGATSFWIHANNDSHIDFDVLFDGVILPAVGMHFDSGANTYQIVEKFMAYLDGDMTKADLHAGYDPFVAKGNADPDAIMAAGFALTKRISAQMPTSIFSVNGWHWHNKGVSAVNELAIILSSVADIFRHAMLANIAPAKIASLIEVTVALPADLYAGMAKCRAVRHGWAAIMAGLGLDPDKCRLRLHAAPSLRMFTLLDQDVNILRSTTALLGGALGNADALTGFAHDILTGETAHGRRLARMTQLLMIEESGIARAIDPAGGSGFIETRADELAKAAWTVFQALESQGGASACYKDDVFDNFVIAGKEKFENAFVMGETNILGVTVQPDMTPIAHIDTDGWCADKIAIARPAMIIEEFRRKVETIQPRIICLLPSAEMDKAHLSLKKQNDQLCAIGGLSVVTLVCGDNTEHDILTAKPDMIIYISNTLDDIIDLRAAISPHLPNIKFVAAADIIASRSLIGALEFLIGDQANA
ncbi:methylmalonyl-CoA mutase family protein [Alphaproteobacteria bacterium]|nr:methylmalonyl-CoA mutase family protein [Alphaproteobacteria bacterium]